MQPSQLLITEFQDQRPADGDLEVTFSNQIKLIQTAGFYQAAKKEIFLIIFPGDERIEMTPEVEITVTK